MNDLTYGLEIKYDGNYNMSTLVDKVTGKYAVFKPKLTNKGWTVALVIGSKKTGRIERALDIGNTYTLHQAQIVASNMTRDVYSKLH